MEEVGVNGRGAEGGAAGVLGAVVKGDKVGKDRRRDRGVAGTGGTVGCLRLRGLCSKDSGDSRASTSGALLLCVLLVGLDAKLVLANVWKFKGLAGEV
jgi:hypothetical protein